MCVRLCAHVTRERISSSSLHPPRLPPPLPLPPPPPRALCRYASKAARFCDACGTHQVLIVKVALGNTHTQTTVCACALSMYALRASARALSMYALRASARALAARKAPPSTGSRHLRAPAWSISGYHSAEEIGFGLALRSTMSLRFPNSLV